MRRSGPTVDLFPFLSVLICAIGILLIVFSGLNLETLENPAKTFVLEVPGTSKRFQGEAFEQRPVYIECFGDGFRVHWDVDDEEEYLFKEKSMDEAVSEIVGEMEAIRAERWPVLCVKPSGIAGMKALYSAFEKTKMQLGKWAFWEEAEFITARPLGAGD